MSTPPAASTPESRPPNPLLEAHRFLRRGLAAHVPGITDFARVWVWLGVLVWTVVFVAMLRRGDDLIRGEHPPTSSQRIQQIAPSRRDPV